MAYIGFHIFNSFRRVFLLLSKFSIEKTHIPLKPQINDGFLKMEIVLERYSQIFRASVSNAPIFDKRYRSSFEIIALILEAACEGASRFAIANRLNTNYFQLRRYLDYLIRIGFIDVEPNGRQILYKTSKKGLEFLRLYNALLKMLLGAGEAQMPAEIAYQSASQMAAGKGRGRRSFGL
jgi:predicted transcriptional regulator